MQQVQYSWYHTQTVKKCKADASSVVMDTETGHVIFTDKLWQTKRALDWQGSPLETRTKAIHKHLAASACAEKYCTSPSTVTKQSKASETELKCVGQTILNMNY